MNTKDQSPIFTINLFSLVQEYGILLKGKEKETLAAIDRYKKLLLLASNNPKITFVPDAETDEIFHLHLLRPSYYYKDTISNFGKVIDHVPQSKLSKNITHSERIEVTKKLWLETYHEKIPDNLAFAWCGVSGNDGGDSGEGNSDDI